MIPGRRLAGPPPATRIPSTPGRDTRCPTGTRRRGALMSVNATGYGRRNAARWAYASNAGADDLRRSSTSANPVSIGDASPSKPDTSGVKPRERHTEAVAPRAAGAWRGRGTGSEGESAPKPGYASVAANFHRRRAASSAIHAARNGERKRGNSTPGAEPPGDAGGAEERSSRELPGALRAPRSNKAVPRRRTP